MERRFSRILMGAFCAFCPMELLTVASAAPALVIGNSDYNNSDLDIPNPAFDAEIMEQKLRALGFDVELILNVDSGSLKQALSDYRNRLADAHPVETTFFYYAGHGVQIDGESFLVPTDVEFVSIEEVKEKSVPISAIVGLSKISLTKLDFFVFDACRNNVLANNGEVSSETRGAAPISLAAEPAGVESQVFEGLGEVQDIENIFVAFSTAPGAIAYDGEGRNSRFTASLAAALSNEFISPRDTFQLARDEVIRITEGRQTPHFIDTITIPSINAWRQPITSAAIPESLLENWADLAIEFESFAPRLFEMRASPDDASLRQSFVNALSFALKLSCEPQCAMRPDYQDENLPEIIDALITNSQSLSAFSVYELIIFLSHASHGTYQFQTLAEYGSDAYHARNDFNQILGNNREGDGFRYRGRGFLQISGRYNYEVLSANEFVGADLVENPDLLATDLNISARASLAMFERFRDQVTGEPSADLELTTRKLTGTTRDIGARGYYFYRLLEAFKRDPAFQALSLD